MSYKQIISPALLRRQMIKIKSHHLEQNSCTGCPLGEFIFYSHNSVLHMKYQRIKTEYNTLLSKIVNDLVT